MAIYGLLCGVNNWLIVKLFEPRVTRSMEKLFRT